MQNRRRDAGYGELVTAWHAVIAMRLSEAATRKACLQIFQHHIDRMALDAIWLDNPTIRFYANMHHLEEQLFPMFVQKNEHLDQMAIVPAWKFVREWITANNFNR